jgi:hypothetical protein
MPYHPNVCTLLYGISCLLDAVDGQAARALGQTSKFGAVLDMVTDRSVARGLAVGKCVDASFRQMHDSWTALFPFVCISDLRAALPVPDCARLCQSLHTHVCVSSSGPSIDVGQETHAPPQLVVDRFIKSQDSYE